MDSRLVPLTGSYASPAQEDRVRITTFSTARRARLTAMASGFFTTAARTMAGAQTVSSAKTSPYAAASLAKYPATTSTADWRYDTTRSR
ncbi:hypothetical protein OOK36_46320 [Streptomyces sp. NBC_00365]|uniref:hypothetical protein n=1 Tax=Streptomyces sp. NBC_00365 TaxID=2975726 RepID=UPI0022539AF0|nr:hypothetical protein [Streptomyces sp. NBC_00365]MCX5096079.1 hypothetical protein [Streptomyces sp. NBC_00365]